MDLELQSLKSTVHLRLLLDLMRVALVPVLLEGLRGHVLDVPQPYDLRLEDLAISLQFDSDQIMIFSDKSLIPGSDCRGIII